MRSRDAGRHAADWVVPRGVCEVQDSHWLKVNRDHPNTWPCFKPLIIAHDVGRSRDRSTAVVGGLGPFEPRLIGIKETEELPQGLYGSARASALAAIDRRYYSDTRPMPRCCLRRLARA
jgi:hypothetical protein